MSEQTLTSFLDTISEALFKEQKKGSDEGRFGVITSFKDGVIQIKGLSDLRMGELVTVQGTSNQALVMNLEKDQAFALVLQSGEGVKEGLFVESNGHFLQMPVSEANIGRVVNALGAPIDGGADLKADAHYEHEKIAPGVIARKSVNTPVQTGIISIDSLVPIGRGQRELIIGDRQTGKTTVAIDTILNQKGQDIICIYVSIGQRESKTAQVYETLRAHGALDYSLVVAAGASESAVMQFLAPYAGSAIAEYFMDKGKECLIIYDDLSKHAVAYREMSLLLRRPPGREAYPGDVFYLHSRLLERAAKLNENHGGGSITALPIIETQAGDVSAYIPTNVISITDGQIFLETDLFNRGIRPAINVGISVSRVGGSAQTKIMKKISGTVKLELSQYYELEAFSQFASDLDEATKKTLTRGRRIVESFKQKQNSPYALWQEVMVLSAATGGYLDAVEAAEIQKKLKQFLTYV
ncbi:MAG: F0F1 ATP synthase subunit alpha, partial [Candidatus Gracilibacteria bacterium]|nr:F0F1 ATP synthase subunit alpha [Candidatus Gracilibacteria bacterium]